MKNKRELIQQYIENWHGAHLSSIQAFYEHGKASGSFLIALKKMMEHYADTRFDILDAKQLRSTITALSQHMLENKDVLHVKQGVYAAELEDGEEVRVQIILTRDEDEYLEFLQTEFLRRHKSQIG